MIWYYIGTFVAGFSLMTVEITASRIVAPIIGSSIFTWASVIGVILFGLSVGNLIGGKIADKYIEVYGQKVLSIAMLFSSVFVYLIIPLSKNTGFFLSETSSIQVLSVIICSLLFLLPSIAMGALSPLIFKLYAVDVKNIGKKYGLFSSIWSLGSILGVFVTGFYFISTIGSSNTIYFIASVLLFLFYFFYVKNMEKRSVYFKRQIILIFSLSILLLLSVYVISQDRKPLSQRVLFNKETAYYSVKVVDYDLFPQFGHNRILFLDIDSDSVQTEKPSKLFYTDIYPVFSAFSNNLKDIYVIGAGAYTLPINLRKYYHDSKISVSEIDSEIENIGRAYFDLDKYNIKTETGDVRIKFNIAQNDQSEKYDLIFGDAYNSLISVPWYLLTKEFASKARDNLNPNGIYAINFIGSLEGAKSEMFESVYSTFKEVFPNNYIFAFGNNPEDIQNITILGVKNYNFLNHDSLKEKLDKIDTTHFLSKILVNKDGINNNNGIKDGLILTDNFAPVESIMTPLIKEYFPKHLVFYNRIVNL